jgi:6-phosphogluconolactonase
VKPEVVVLPAPELTQAAAAALARELASAIAARGACRLALAGGSTPRPVYEALAAPPFAAQVDWSRVHLFFGDERCVPPEDAASNYRMAKAALLDRVKIPPAQVHRISGERPPAEAARAYAQVLGKDPLDVAVLGLGDDGHTASIFPATQEAPGTRVMATVSPVAPLLRVSLTTQSLSEARAVFFLVSGEKKAARVAQVFEQLGHVTPELPAARVRPKSGRLVFFLDAPAASRLQKEE